MNEELLSHIHSRAIHCYTPKTNIMLYVNYLSIIKKKRTILWALFSVPSAEVDIE